MGYKLQSTKKGSQAGAQTGTSRLELKKRQRRNPTDRFAPWLALLPVSLLGFVWLLHCKLDFSLPELLPDPPHPLISKTLLSFHKINNIKKKHLKKENHQNRNHNIEAKNQSDKTCLNKSKWDEMSTKILFSSFCVGQLLLGLQLNL